MSEIELPEGIKFDKWSPDLQLYALEKIRRDIPENWRPFYCSIPDCDGNPHGTVDGWDFPHARSKQHPPKGDWFVWLVRAGRAWGKLLPLSTRVPTPNGWTTMGELRDGDEVFDEDGNVCRVVKAHEPHMPEKAYELTFSDGETITAGGEHQWVTWTHADRKAYNRNVGEGLPESWPRWRSVATTVAHGVGIERTREVVSLLAQGRSQRAVERETGVCRQTIAKILTGNYNPDGSRTPRNMGVGPKVRTTQDIVDTFTYGKNGNYNHSIPVAGPLQYPEQDLLIDPYILGAWLGDGSRGTGCFTVHIDDMPFLVDSLHGYKTTQRLDRNNTWTVSALGLLPQLREVGVLTEKFIPDAYLRGSVQQRLALLQGLMDTDGYVESAKAEFTTVLPRMADSVLELVRSLGEKPRMYREEATLDGRVTGPKFRVVWHPTFNPFRLPRKAARYIPTTNSRNFHRMIVGFREVEPEMMRCITVDSPNSMYLVGDGMIPTHNTLTASHYFNRLALEPVRMSLIGRRSKDIRDTMIEGVSGLLATAPPGNVPFYEPSKMKLTWPSGAVAYGFSGEEPDSLRGPEFQYCWLDEPAHIPLIEDVWMNLTLGLRNTPTGGKSKRQRIVVTSTPLPSKWIKKLNAEPTTVVTVGSTWENEKNLSEVYKKAVLTPLAGTHMGRQEIEGEILMDMEGALWKREMIRHVLPGERPAHQWEFDRIVVSIDPAGSARARSDETGIVVLGKLGDIIYVLQDASGKYTPHGWASRVVQLYDYWKADSVVAEVNFGRDMVGETIKSTGAALRVIPVDSRRGKVLRAEPVVALYEAEYVYHFPGMSELEDQMTEWVVGEGSPDRVDALVHGCTELAMLGAPASISRPYFENRLLMRRR